MGYQADDHSRVLNGLVRIIELAAHGAYIRPLSVHQKLLHPVDRDHLGVVVQKQDIFALRLFYGEVVDPGITLYNVIVCEFVPSETVTS